MNGCKPAPLSETDRLSEQTAHEILGALAVVKGNAQLVERALRRADDPLAERLRGQLKTLQERVDQIAREVVRLRDGLDST